MHLNPVQNYPTNPEPGPSNVTAGQKVLQKETGHLPLVLLNCRAMQEDFHGLIENRKRTTFLLVCLSALALLFIKKSFIEDRTAAFEFLAERPEGSMLALRSALQYAAIPLVYLWKFTVVGFIIWVGSFSLGFRITFGQCWRVSMAAELIWILPEIIRIIYFLFIETTPDFYRIQAFYPFSLMNFADHTTLPSAYHYPLKSINLFEPLYGAVLAKGLALVSGRPYRDMVRVILVSYLPLMLAWLLFWIAVYR